MKTSPLQTEEELLLVKACAVLPVLLDSLEQDLRSMQAAGVNSLYIERLKDLQKSIITRLTQLKKNSRARSIIIMETRRKEHSLQIIYQCRGYQHQMELQWDFVKADMERRLAGALHLNLE
ncbi:hypothetical protein [Paenibacillus lemnae]|uniref:Uncharacterized protein n=1 Tax=Paenibacillus lemnae TaxID=1330551 RepID=A0A848M175_PAELE|nr:hypothetical protein [Paenibacillus lemnae]NMO94607.1 hypothetical protein [Paenibacillus lemnae]